MPFSISPSCALAPGVPGSTSLLTFHGAPWQVAVRHEAPVAPGLCSLSPSRPPGGEAAGAAPDAGPVLEARQVATVSHVAATVAPLTGRWVLQGRGAAWAQEVCRAVPAPVVSDTTALGPTQAGGHRPWPGDQGAAPLFSHTLLHVGEAEVEGCIGEGCRLTRVGVSEAWCDLDFDAALLLLGLATVGARWVGGLAAQLQRGKGPTGPGARTGQRQRQQGRQPLAPLVVELRAQALRVCAHVGDTDVVELSLGLCRASSRLKVRVILALGHPPLLIG